MSSHLHGVHHIAISVRDVAKSIAFYEALGFRETNHYIEDDGSLHIVQLSANDIGLEIFWYAKNADSVKPQLGYANDLDVVGVKHLCVRTDDIDKTLSWLQAQGHADSETKINVARSLADSRYMFIQDPDGMWVECIEDNRGKG